MSVDMTVDLESTFLGGMLGSALGDAIGEMAFSGPGETELRSKIGQMDELVYTDDTAMAIGVAESLIQKGDLEPQHLGDTFRVNFRREPWRGYASGPPTIFALVERHGMSYTEAARSLFGGLGSLGNGAAMRVVPIGLFFYGNSDLYEKARTSAAVTHAHPIGIDGAAVLARAVAQAVGLSPQEPFPIEQFLHGVMEFARTPTIRDKVVHVGTLVADGVPPSEAAARLGRSVAVHESMPYALYSFLRHPTSYEACLFCAIMHGGDRDTLGAMACAISGAYLGVEAIPLLWRRKCENHDYIEALARTLAEMKTRG